MEKTLRIAVPYDQESGNIFEHFGHTEFFAVYDVTDKDIVEAEVYSSDGVGHEALAQALYNTGVNLLICGGIGQGAMDALVGSGVAVISGVSGPANDAVEAFLAGKLVTAGVNCDHHSQEGEHSCKSTCGEGCGGCPGCH